MPQAIIEIPATLVQAVEASGYPAHVTLLEVQADQGARRLRAVPAQPGALGVGCLATGDRVPELDHGGHRMVIHLGAQGPSVHATPVMAELIGATDFGVEIYDDAAGKGQRRNELVRASGGQLGAAHIGIVGVGSLGSSAFGMLVRNGFIHFAAVDGDRVEGHNVTKSLIYTAEHVGRFKTDVLASWGKLVEPGLTFKSFTQPLDAAFIQEHGDDFLKDLDLVYFSANSIAAVSTFVEWLDRRRAAGEALPLVLVHLVFENARASIIIYWDPHDQATPCPACFFASNPRIHDSTAEPVDEATYSPVRVTNSTPQIASDIAQHVALACSYAVGLLTGSPERLEVLAQKPWLYTFSLRGAAPHLEWTSTEHAGSSHLWPTYPGRPFEGCSCCRAAGRVRSAAPQFPERRRA